MSLVLQIDSPVNIVETINMYLYHEVIQLCRDGFMASRDYGFAFVLEMIDLLFLKPQEQSYM